MRRFLLITLIALVVLAVILAGAAWFLLNTEGFLKSQVSRIALAQTGRELNIDGLLDLDIGKRTRLQAEGIRFQNADWATEPEMVRLGRLDVTVDIPSLFDELPFIPDISIEDCEIVLVENDQGEANWDILPAADTDLHPQPIVVEPPAPEGLPVQLQDAQLKNCRLSFDTPQRDRPLSVEADALTLQIGEDRRVRAQASGRINDQPFSFDGNYFPLNAFIAGGAVEHQLEANLGDIRLSSSGSMEDAVELTGVNLDAHFTGPEIGRILAEYDLPPLSEGDFDFKARLNTVGQMTRIDIDGDLGSLDMQADGELDRLKQPRHGSVKFSIDGPNLQALGRAIGEQGLVAEPYSLRGEAVFDAGRTSADSMVIETAHDRLEFTGTIGPVPDFADSDVTFKVVSREIGRWRSRLGLPERLLGEIQLDGELSSDADGFFTAQADLRHAGAEIRANGALGSLQGVLQPDLEIEVHAPDLESLGLILGLDDLPATPADVKGGVALSGQQVTFNALNLDLAGNHASIDGVFNLADDHAGSELDVTFQSPNLAELGTLFGQDGLPVTAADARGGVALDGKQVTFKAVKVDFSGNHARIDGVFNLADDYSGTELDVGFESPDLAELGKLFGKDGLPVQPIALNASLKLLGKALEFVVRDGNLGDINLELDGRIPDRDNPLAVDANFDVRLPSLTAIGFLLPDTELPDQPFTARGRLHNEQTFTRLSDVQATLGPMQASVDGDIGPDHRLNLDLRVSGPDASALSGLVGQDLPAYPYSVATHLEGTAQAFDLDGLEVALGESRVNGDLAIARGERITVRGRIDAPNLDLGWLQSEPAEEEPEPDTTPRDWVFDETPVLQVDDYGVDVDLDIDIVSLDLGNTALRDLRLGIELAPNFLQLNPISLSGLVGGAIAGEFLMDARDGPAVLRYTLNASALRMGLMAVEGQDPETYPPIDIELHFDGRGATRREMASGLNGKVRVYLDSGQVARAGVGLIFSDFLSELFSVLNPFAETSEFTQLECGVVAADIADGQVTVYPFVFNTTDITIVSKGSVDLKTEDLDFSFNTKPRKGVGLSAGVLVNPFIKVGGRLVSPAVELDPQRAAVSSGLAVATAGVSLLAKSVSDRYLGSKDPCGDARAEIVKSESGQN
jgi:uncharacterized protein involved in outer membrane biogenesis